MGLLVDRFDHCMFEVLFRSVWVFAYCVYSF